MTVTVHRGTGQIGGNLIEISAGSTRLLFDAGANLPPLDESQSKDDFELEGLTWGGPAFDWVFISHHHDHCGLIGRILPGIPILESFTGLHANCLMVSDGKQIEV